MSSLLASRLLLQDDSRLLVTDLLDTVIVSTAPVECPLRLVLLDAGISNTLAPRDLANLRATITSIILGQVSALACCKVEPCTRFRSDFVLLVMSKTSVIVSI